MGQWNDPDCDPVRDMREYIAEYEELQDALYTGKCDIERFPGYCFLCRQYVDVTRAVYWTSSSRYHGLPICTQCGCASCVSAGPQAKDVDGLMREVVD